MAFNISYIYQAIDKFTPVARKINRSVDRITNKVKISGKAINKMGQSLGSASRKISALAAIGAGFAIKSFTSFETALLGVAKTANIKLGPELDKFGDKFTELSLKIPVSAKELLNFGQAAAQLGVKGKDNIIGFAETMAKLTKTTNIAGEEGSAQLARLIKITGGSTAQVSNFASSLVELGNTTAATEAEILEFATRLASSGTLFGITGVQALGLAATLRSVGIRSEEGGSSIARALGAINKAIIGNGKELIGLSELTNIASKDLKKAFGDDAIGILTKFSVGLDRFISKGGDATRALSFFGLEGIRDLRTIGSLAKNTGLLTEKLNQSATAFEENTALEKEFAIQSTSLANKFTLLFNKVKKLGKELTIIFRPAIEGAIDGVAKFISSISDIAAVQISLTAGEKARSKIEEQIQKTKRETVVLTISKIQEQIQKIPAFILSNIQEEIQKIPVITPSKIEKQIQIQKTEVFTKLKIEKQIQKTTTPDLLNKGVAIQDISIRNRLDGNININAPAGVVSSVDARTTGVAMGNLGLNLVGVGQ